MSPPAQRQVPFLLVDVFAAGAPFSGNPLAVFPDLQRGTLSDPEMAALARQMNLSETTFVLPSSVIGTDAHVRIFTPSYEMPFAGHPTLGTAWVLAQRLGRQGLVLAMAAGPIPVGIEGDRVTLTVGLRGSREVEVPPAEVAAAVGLSEDCVAGPVLRVDTGTEQVILPVHSPEDVKRLQVDGARFLALPRGKQPTKVLVWAKSGPDEVCCRFFFPVGSTVAEDPGTGSAAANLGGWLIATGHAGALAGPLRWKLSQGALTGRPCELYLSVEEERISVGGRVVLRGEGKIFL